MRALIFALVACGSTTSRAPNDEAPAATEVVESQPQSNACPRRPLVAGEMSFDDAPTFSRELWLDYAISMADVVVEGSVDDTTLSGEVICGHDHEGRSLHRLHASARGTGVWMLVRTPRGHLVLNPDREPLGRAQWDALVARSEPRDALTTETHETGNQIYRTAEIDGNEVWHGVEISQTGDEVHVALHERGESSARIAFDSHGIERVILHPPTGRGFMLQNARGALWRYEHYVDRELVGTSRTFARGTDQLVAEAHHRDGRMHGRQRTWEDGQLERDVTYEDGLITPIVPYSGEPGEASMHFGTDGDVSYSAPRPMMDAIQVGMRAREVAQLLKLPISPAMGVRFDAYRCEEALTIRFRAQRVSEREILPNGAHCM